MLAAIGTMEAQQRKQPVKKTTVSAEEHLCFEGVPIDGDVASFVKKLTAKGIKVPPKEGKHSTLIKGLHYYIMAIEFFVVSDKLLSDKNLEKRDKNITKHNNHKAETVW